MKQIKAFIHPHRISAVTDALRDSGICNFDAGIGCLHFTVSNVQRLYTSADPSRQRYSLDLGEPVVAETKLELICEDAVADQIATLIANAGKPSAGWVFVTDIQSAIRIA